MAEYRCCRCGDKFDYLQHCILHSMEWGHEEFEMPSTEIKTIIKPKK